MSSPSFSTPIQDALPLAPRYRAALDRLELRTVGDLLEHYPRRYEDRRALRRIAELRTGDVATVRGVVRSVKPRRTRTGKPMVEIEVEDETGRLELVWFHRVFVADVLAPGVAAFFHGEAKLRRRLQMVAPEFEIDESSPSDTADLPLFDSVDTEAADETGTTERQSDAASIQESANMRRIVPVYPVTRGLPQRALRKLLFEACRLELSCDSGAGPFELLDGSGPSRIEAFRQVHFPESTRALEAARSRLVFDEYFAFASRMEFRRRRFKSRVGIPIAVTPDLDRKIRSLFPFEFTPDQNRAAREIAVDLAADSPAYRLVQGEVGSGKTAVAIYALLAAVRNGYQAALMAPTEVLAEQHFASLGTLLRDHPAVRTELLTGSVAAGRRTAMLESIASGETHIVVGTHALIQDAVRFHSLGVAVIDEQHRFGVRERGRFQVKAEGVNLIVMSATPIPRSLCLTAYGDLDLTILASRPPGRSPVRTVVFDETKRDWARGVVASELRKGRQAYFIYPLIDASPSRDAPAAEAALERLQKEFPHDSVDLLHGRMSGDQKERVLRRFRDGESRILVATVVVEVGIDVPNATVLTIEDASRFGLAQLHQLRGRVGRGRHPGICLVGASEADSVARERLEVFERTDDGFRIAEEDLRLRGPGDFLGLRQSGRPAFRIGNPFRDREGFERVRSHAGRFWSEPRFEAAARRYLESNPQLLDEGDADALD